MKKIIFSIALVSIISLVGITFAQTFPITLNSWSAGQTISSAWANALEKAIGVASSTDATSLDYQINHLFGVRTTSNLAEGTNLYYTPVRVNTAINNLISASSTIFKTDVAGTITASTTFSKQVIVPNVTSADIDKAANVDYVNAQVSAGVSSSTDSVYGKSRLSVAAADVNYPIVVGDNDPRTVGGVYNGVFYPRETYATTSNAGILSTSTINVISTSTDFDLYFEVASSSNARLHMYFNNGYGGSAYSDRTSVDDDAAGVSVTSASSTCIASCGSVLTRKEVWVHIENTQNNAKKIYSRAICYTDSTKAIGQSFSVGYWTGTAGISSISIIPNIPDMAGAQLNFGLSSTTMRVYQK